LNGTTGNEVEFVIGASEDAVHCDSSIYSTVGSTTADISSGMGLDVTNAYTQLKAVWGNSGAATEGTLSGHINIIPTIGYHFISLNQNGAGSGTSAWYGSTNLGLSGWVRG
jgi:hypothetical protein